MGTLLATFELGDYLCGVVAADVQEVSMAQPRTPAPGAAACIAGLINLRGQVVPTLDLRARMGVRAEAATSHETAMSVVVRWQDEVWSLLVDRIGDVIEVQDSQFEPAPDTLTGPWRHLILGAYKLESQLLLMLDVPALLDVSAELAAAH
ncbi:MAG TPA: chemotaxis protein CheW [Jatrophihabitans sp.]|nr:chemotaxis protein CheW [Jatrophihabitans sp.]